MKAEVGDYIRHPDDGKLYRVIQIETLGGEPTGAYIIDDASFVRDDEISYDDVLLESEGYDEFYGQVK